MAVFSIYIFFSCRMNEIYNYLYIIDVWRFVRIISMKQFISLICLITFLTLAGCVPARKYEELEAKYNKSLADAELFKTKLIN